MSSGILEFACKIFSPHYDIKARRNVKVRKEMMVMRTAKKEHAELIALIHEYNQAVKLPVRDPQNENRLLEAMTKYAGKEKPPEPKTG